MNKGYSIIKMLNYVFESIWFNIQKNYFLDEGCLNYDLNFWNFGFLRFWISGILDFWNFDFWNFQFLEFDFLGFWFLKISENISIFFDEHPKVFGIFFWKYFIVENFFRINRQISLRSLQKYTFWHLPWFFIWLNNGFKKIAQNPPKNCTKITQNPEFSCVFFGLYLVSLLFFFLLVAVERVP